MGDLEDRLDAIEREIDELARDGALGRKADPRVRRVVTARLEQLRRRARDAAPDALFTRPSRRGVRGILEATDSYGFVLVLISALIWVLVPLSAGDAWARLPTAMVFGFAVVIALHTSLVRRDLLVTITLTVGALFVALTVAELLGSRTLRAIADLGYGLVLAGTGGVVLRRVLAHRVVTSRTLSGAVAVYLLLAAAFASLFTALEGFDARSFDADDLAQPRFATLLYFSLVTLTTVGYGDIEPVTEPARALATLEAVLGSVYLVIIVARLVSLYGATEEAEELVELAGEVSPADDADGAG